MLMSSARLYLSACCICLQATVLWRQESGANDALATPHPRFDLIKKHYPTYFHGKVWCYRSVWVGLGSFGWDNSAAMGPWLVPFTDASQIDDARIVTTVNDEVRQDDTINRMMFPIRRQIEYISTFMTLQPGDIIITGTPTGAGARFDPPRYLAPGDVVKVTVEGVGTLINGVEDES